MALSEEFALTTAELSYLQDRKVAYENLAKRTGLEGVKSVCLSLMQSERYGTPLGQSLRVMAQENRDMRMNEAEKKAAALPPKLTVPMILFFLPCLFIVILGPTYIKIQMMPWGAGAATPSPGCRSRQNFSFARTSASSGLRLRMGELAPAVCQRKRRLRKSWLALAQERWLSIRHAAATPGLRAALDDWITRVGGDNGCGAQSGRLRAATGTVALLPGGREWSLSLRLSISRR